MKNLVLYIGFVYMVIHLSIIAFKKGEKIRATFTDEVGPQLKSTFIGSVLTSTSIYAVKLKSLISAKHKLIKAELNKPYNHYISEELLNVLIKSKNPDLIKQEIEKIYDYKETLVYKNFSFDDDILQSRRLQFHDIKHWIYEAKHITFMKAIYKMYENEMFSESEKEMWSHQLKQNHLLNDDGSLTNVDLELNHAYESGKITEVEEDENEVTRTRVLI